MVTYDVAIVRIYGETSLMAGAADTPDRRDQPELPQPQERPERDQPVRQSLTQLQHRLDKLPDGHPSSSYREDGSRRAPAVKLKDLEILEEDPEDQRDAALKAADTPGSTENVATDKWREARPTLEAAWRSHLERWPEEDRIPIDRSTDEPGSWRGDGGQYLNRKDNVDTERFLDRINRTEPDVTRAMKTIEESVPGALLVGLEGRLKGVDRFKEKVAYEVSEKSDRTIEEVADRIPDKIRYTCQFRTNQYTDGYWNVREKLEEQGIEILLVRNSWEELEYKGINTRWLTPEGQTFEVQFHTADSFEAKQLTHEAYERLRSGKALGAERSELEEFQQIVTSRVDVPDRAAAVPNYRREGY